MDTLGAEMLSFVGRLSLGLLASHTLNPKVESVEGSGLQEVEFVVWYHPLFKDVTIKF